MLVKWFFRIHAYEKISEIRRRFWTPVSSFPRSFCFLLLGIEGLLVNSLHDFFFISFFACSHGFYREMTLIGGLTPLPT